MTLPRPALLAVLGLCLAAAVFLTLRSITAQDPPAAPPAPTTPAPAASPSQRSAPSSRSPRPARPRALATAPPAPVVRALRSGRALVLFFSQPSGADDAATRHSVRALAARPPRRVAVFSDGIDDIGRYRSILGSVRVSQAPAVVIVPRRRSRARALEGFIDEASLRQHVIDAQR